MAPFFVLTTYDPYNNVRITTSKAGEKLPQRLEGVWTDVETAAREIRAWQRQNGYPLSEIMSDDEDHGGGEDQPASVAPYVDLAADEPTAKKTRPKVTTKTVNLKEVFND
jgi:hypothetical protein